MSRGPRVAVAVFPGTWSERDFADLAEPLGWDVHLVWHTAGSLGGADAVVLPGGFAHGDHLRTGAIARFSPVMRAVEAFAQRGGPVLGSCNGFQILCEAGMLPGVLLRNDHLEFRCDWQHLRVEAACGPWLAAEEVRPGDVIRLPISHGAGRYHADPDVLDALEASGRVVLRYADASGAVTDAANPNGSAHGIAGIVNERGNVLGLMPHPERAADPEVGGTDGLRLLRSLDAWLAAQPAAAERRS
ncbi:MAG TPA: phosphoribosylformylglycinamidine synthase subunit PurQ [candidate division Zixibacteria bacterium]|nr:phosphoribosylformylglycinamidine synthase subunit PurQ [candidate division Zixibacteria bacterium]